MSMVSKSVQGYYTDNGIFGFCNRQDLFPLQDLILFSFAVFLLLFFSFHMRLQYSLNGRGLFYIFLNI